MAEIRHFLTLFTVLMLKFKQVYDAFKKRILLQSQKNVYNTKNNQKSFLDSKKLSVRSVDNLVKNSLLRNSFYQTITLLCKILYISQTLFVILSLSQGNV